MTIPSDLVPSPIPTSTQLGAVAEHLVANILMIESDGRLSPFSPQADDDGIDLLIDDKESGKALPAQIKSRRVTLRKKGSGERVNVAHFEVRMATFKVERFAVAILVLLGSDGYSFDCGWVLPMREVPDVARKGRTNYVIRASKSPTSSDRFRKYRCDSPTEFLRRVLRELLAEPTPRG